MSVEQFEDDSRRIVLVGKSVGLVRIYMHGKGVGGADPYDHVRKNKRSLIACSNDKDDIIIFDMGADRVHRSHMDMPFRDNYSPLEFQSAFGADQGTSGCAFQVSDWRMTLLIPSLLASVTEIST